MKSWTILILLSTALAACTIVTSNPIGPISTAIYGHNGYVRVFMNSDLWLPDSVSTIRYPSPNANGDLVNSHIEISGWSEGYSVKLSFDLPDTLRDSVSQSYVLCRTAGADFLTPWPGRNAWQHAGDSSGVLTAKRLNDSTISGTFHAKFESAIATYWLEGGSFFIRVKPVF